MSNELIWRDATLDDVPEIEALASKCDEVYGTLETTVVDGLRHELRRSGGSAQSLVVSCDGRVVAAGWVRRVSAGSQQRDLVYALSDPARADLHDEVLRSLLERCVAPAGDDVQRIERVLAPAAAELPKPMTDAYTALGFRLKYIEHEMVCGVRPPTETPPTSVGDITIAPWSPGRHAEIRTAYNDAFRDRGFEGYGAGDWEQVFPAAEMDAPASFVALEGDVVVGFTLAADSSSQPEWVDPATRGCGWIGNVGVVPGQRGRGLATALVAASIEAFRDAGLDRAALRVNDDNDRARRVYERLGFAPVRKHVVYERRA